MTTCPPSTLQPAYAPRPEPTVEVPAEARGFNVASWTRYHGLAALCAEGQPVDDELLCVVLTMTGRTREDFAADVAVLTSRRAASESLTKVAGLQSRQHQVAQEKARAGERLAALRREYREKLRALETEYGQLRDEERQLSREHSELSSGSYSTLVQTCSPSIDSEIAALRRRYDELGEQLRGLDRIIAGELVPGERRADKPDVRMDRAYLAERLSSLKWQANNAGAGSDQRAKRNTEAWQIQERLREIDDASRRRQETLKTMQELNAKIGRAEASRYAWRNARLDGVSGRV